MDLKLRIAILIIVVLGAVLKDQMLARKTAESIANDDSTLITRLSQEKWAAEAQTRACLQQPRSVLGNAAGRAIGLP